ncbi:O-antigen ligase family protein [Phaeobacter marinintestinus]|uniref:O-antigen ligase family protein n=1 Tax=Falsiphaeobacter marinintestinus TaxID=1492905 RepID=UPI0011B37004|nr:O-antigen ligase family protein [Phaeobacter marinintestinus]
MPNLFASFMLLIWPLICLRLLRKLPLERAIVWCLLGGFLILPPIAAFDLPLVPAMDKFSIPSVALMGLLLFVLKVPITLWPRTLITRILLILFVLSVIPTVLTNRDPIEFEVLAGSDPVKFIVGSLPGLSVRDLFSVVASQIIVLIPFVLGRQYMSTDTGMREILLGLVIGMLIYSIPALIEVRFSPQINVWVYGFFQHSFEQMMRKGGFRPLVFLPHALWLAFFMLSAVIAAAALSRIVGPPLRRRYQAAVVYLLIVLFLCKSLASWVFALVLAPLVLLTSAKMQIRVAILCGIIAVGYPILRNTGAIPLDDILVQAYAFDEERGGSLEYRFNNEEQLLDRAAEKPWFGWGGWGRNLIRHGETGEILTIPDGRWIIVFGTFGWVGYVAEMGLLAFPLMLLGFQMRTLRSNQLSPYVAPISIILAATMMDMLLNATLTPYTWLCAGAVLGYCERLRYPEFERRKPRLFGDGPVLGGRAKPHTTRDMM